MDKTFRSRLIEQLSNGKRHGLRFVHFAGSNRLTELAEYVLQTSLSGAISVATNFTLTMTLLGAFGIWHLNFSNWIWPKLAVDYRIHSVKGNMMPQIPGFVQPPLGPIPPSPGKSSPTETPKHPRELQSQATSLCEARRKLSSAT